MRAKWNYLADKKAGEMTNAVITESERLGGAFTICLSLLASVVVTAIYVVLSLFIAWQITLSLIGFAAVAALAMSRFYRKTYAVGQSSGSAQCGIAIRAYRAFRGGKIH